MGMVKKVCRTYGNLHNLVEYTVLSNFPNIYNRVENTYEYVQSACHLFMHKCNFLNLVARTVTDTTDTSPWLIF